MQKKIFSGLSRRLPQLWSGSLRLRHLRVRDPVHSGANQELLQKNHVRTGLARAAAVGRPGKFVSLLRITLFEFNTGNLEYLVLKICKSFLLETKKKHDIKIWWYLKIPNPQTFNFLIKSNFIYFYCIPKYLKLSIFGTWLFQR